MMTCQFSMTCLATLLFLFTSCSQAFIVVKPPLEKTGNSNGIPKVTVELAIVCDLSCGQLFDHNVTEVHSYWTAFMWDLHLRFQTLPNTNISFVVTSLTVLQEHDDRSFINNAKTAEDKISLSHAGDLFAEWMYSHMNKIPSFDMAFAVTGLDLADSSLAGSPENAKACNVDHGQGFINCSFIIPLRYDAPVVLASYLIIQQLGLNTNWITLGDAFFVGSGNFAGDMAEIMRKSDTVKTLLPKILDSRKFYFNEADMKPIQNFLVSNQAECLRRRDSDAVAIVDTALLTISDIKPVALDKQCQIYTRDISAIAVKNKSHCNLATCILPKGSKREEKTVHPVDGGSCENNGRCFRGRCYQPGLQLVNVATNKCLVAGNQMSDIGPYFRVKPEMVDCDKQVATPLHQVFIQDVPQLGQLVVTPYDGIGVTGWISNSTGVLDVCLMEVLDKDKYSEEYNGSLTFWNCKEAKATAGIIGPVVGWTLIAVGSPQSGEFVMSQKHTSRCVTTETDSKDDLVTSSNCFANEPKVRWKLMDANGKQVFGYPKINHFQDVVGNDNDEESEVVLFAMTTFIILIVVVFLVLRFGPKIQEWCKCRRNRGLGAYEMNS